MTAPELDRRISAPARRGPRPIALGWAAVTFLALAAVSGGPGVSRDEAAVIEAAASRDAALHAGAPRASEVRPSPPLGASLAAATHAVARRAGFPHLVAWRLGSALFGALLSALLALFAFDLAGPGAALLAPALYWFAPRQLQLGAIATPDTAAAALWLLTAWAYRQSSAAPSAGARRRGALLAGLAFGGALAARLDAWVLLPALALHAIAARLFRLSPRAEAEPGAPSPAPRGVPGAGLSLAAMVILGPLVLLAAWPWLWADPLHRLAAAAAGPSAAWDYLGVRLAGTRPPLGYPLVVTALTVPAAMLLCYAGGLADAIARLVRSARGERSLTAADDLLLLLGAAAPIVAAAVGAAPLAAGVRPWLPAFPFLALLGARALLTAAASAAPTRAVPFSLALALLALYPGLRQAVHAWPAGASAWSELAGGAPGAASLGMQRQDGGEATAAVLEELGARARPGARVLFASATPEAIRIYRADGRLRPDLEPVEDPERADLAVVTLDGGSRDAEYRVWSAFRTARPCAAAFLDEVPLVVVYARPGAWL
jgi:hypothetical protein